MNARIGESILYLLYLQQCIASLSSSYVAAIGIGMYLVIAQYE
jgi:hypothetical protein